jgi:hypothetical protein
VNAFVYRKRTAVDVRLRLLDYAIGAEADAYEDVLVALSTGVRKSAQRIDRAPQDDDAFIMDETQTIENMLGTAYVVCQNEITAVVQAALRLDDAAKASIFLGSKPAERESSVCALGPKFDGTFSKVEVLWHLGNYFKHRDEWDPVTWNGANRFTLDAIKAAGLKPGSSGNLRQGAEALGNTEYSDMDVFQEGIRSWGVDVRKRILARLPAARTI